jgi:hypothetical protein
MADRHGGPPLHDPKIHPPPQRRTHTFRRCGRVIPGQLRSRCSMCARHDRVLEALRSRRNTAHNAFATIHLSGGRGTKRATNLFAWPTGMVVLLCMIP